MKTERLIWKRGRHAVLVAAGLLVGCGAMLSCSGYDLDDREPDWPGADLSIYGYLQGQGTFTNMVRIIDDLNYREVLDKTGSKTLFAADDDAFSRFYQRNDWGVKGYEGLSIAQKRMLLFGAMIDNSYQVQALSSTEGPIEGNCMRRQSSLSIYDTVTVMQQKDIPNAIYWQNYQDREQLVVMHDMTPTPMIHFIERHMANKQITNDDYDFLFNHTTKRQSGDAWSFPTSQLLSKSIVLMYMPLLESE